MDGGNDMMDGGNDRIALLMDGWMEVTIE